MNISSKNQLEKILYDNNISPSFVSMNCAIALLHEAGFISLKNKNGVIDPDTVFYKLLADYLLVLIVRPFFENINGNMNVNYIALERYFLKPTQEAVKFIDIGDELIQSSYFMKLYNTLSSYKSVNPLGLDKIGVFETIVNKKINIENSHIPTRIKFTAQSMESSFLIHIDDCQDCTTFNLRTELHYTNNQTSIFYGQTKLLGNLPKKEVYLKSICIKDDLLKFYSVSDDIFSIGKDELEIHFPILNTMTLENHLDIFNNLEKTEKGLLEMMFI